MIYINLPEENMSFVGYLALIEKYELDVVLPQILSVVSSKHKKYEQDMWQVFTPRHMPEDSLYGHLVFALKYEAVDLAVLNALFCRVEKSDIENIILSEPSGSYARRIWFLYEYLQEEILAIEDAVKGNFVDLLDDNFQYTGSSRPSSRHRVNNNLPGVKNFCPLIRRTKKLDDFVSQDFLKLADQNIRLSNKNIIARASKYLLLADSQASYNIEGENPSYNKAEGWANIIGGAGQKLLSHEEFLYLQKQVLSGVRFVHMGYRKEGGFVGGRDVLTNTPEPDHISAKFDDIEILMSSLIETASLLKESDYPPVLAAASIAFGFVFIHPFEDGNGRIHRYLIHHILSSSGFGAKNVIFPISAVILDQISQYRYVLESFSKPRLPHIKWRSTSKGNIEVLNDTIDLYRFFDSTKQAEFLYDCIYEAITNSIPNEIEYLRKYDLMESFIKNYIDMPDNMVSLLIGFLYQNKGTLSKRAKKKEFAELEDSEVKTLEDKFQEIFFS